MRPVPEVAIVTQWPAGKRFTATVADGLEDLPQWRATRAWWQAALAQTALFAPASPWAHDATQLAQVQLRISPDSQSLSVVMMQGGKSWELTQGSYAIDSTTPDLLLAIDHAAWCTRLALGEKALAPKPVGAITSRNPSVVVAVADAIELVQTGAFGSAYQTLRKARQRDGGAPYLLDQLASMELLRGNATAAERICREALSYTDRTSASVEHRLARTLLMARSAMDTQDAGTFDLQLAALATVARRERPYDDEPVWTAALADNFTGKFQQARPLLEHLLDRQPQRAFVPYHLGWSCLGLGDANAAAEHLSKAALRLPTPWVLLPRAIALYEAGQSESLSQLLDSVLQEYGANSRDTLTHQVLRMQAAHAILQGKNDQARRLIMQDFQWLLDNPLALTSNVGDFANEGALLVRLGSSEDLPLMLSRIQQTHPGSMVADASAYIAGMHQVQTTGARAQSIETLLSRDGDSAWSSLLEAFAHERVGQVGDMQNALASAARMSSAPMTKALLAKSLDAVGKLQEAQQLRTALRREMTEVHLRRSCEHPVFGPELAYAYLLN
jgi:tetratricopeptide (TPR) repeat protein